MLRNAMEYIGTFLVKTIKILIFWHKPFLKSPFTRQKFPFDLYDVANKQHKPVFESCRKCAFYAVLKKSEISSNFYQFFKNTLKLNQNYVVCVL